MGSQYRWPPRIIQDFAVRMAGHGFSVSGTMMHHDRGYALEQLQHAHTLADDHLRELAMELFRHFERQQSGLGCVS
jgi:hypothetical protein